MSLFHRGGRCSIFKYIISNCFNYVQCLSPLIAKINFKVVGYRDKFFKH